MKIAIIGSGKMGKWFAKFFLKQGFSVVASDKDEEKLFKIKEELPVETANNLEAVKSARRILICVPIENFESVVAEISPHIRSDHQVMDICSIKELPVKIMHKYLDKAVTLGTHPLFGPGVKSIRKQNFILTPTCLKEEKLAKDFSDWLKEREVNVFMMSPRRHDELMSIVLGIPYFLGLTICDTLIGQGLFSEARRISGASYKLLSTLIEAIASEEADLIANIQIGLPDAAKVEERYLKKAVEWLRLQKSGDKQAFTDKVKLLKNELAKIQPDYSKSYEAMHKMLETLKSEN